MAAPGIANGMGVCWMLLGDQTMTILTVHAVPEAVHRALCARAARHGRSAEAEARAILQDTVAPDLHAGQAADESKEASKGLKALLAAAPLDGIALDRPRDLGREAGQSSRA